jgi:membrane protein YqaA with SNARE-associated domain
MDNRRKLAAQASRPDAQVRLFALSIMDGAFLPAAADLMMVPMALLSPDRAFRYALVASFGSTLGAVGGYLLGLVMFQFLAPYGVMPQWLLMLLGIFQMYAPIFVMPGAFSNVPFNVVTFLSGMAGVNLGLFLLMSVLVRTARYMVIATLIWRGGGRYQEWLERNFSGFTLVVTVALLVLSVMGVLFFETGNTIN